MRGSIGAWSRAAAAGAALALLAACGSSGSGASSSKPASTDKTTTTTVTFTGDHESEFCIRARAWKALPAVNTAEPKVAEAQYRAQADGLRSLIEVAPPEVAAAVRTTSSILDRFLLTLAKYQWDITEVPKAEVPQKEIAASADRVNLYAAEVCDATIEG
jgi:hypothetical protein